MNIPNQLTMGRIVMIPVFIVVYLWGYNYWAALIFVIAAATDALDGYLARKWNLVSNFGKIMDPLADKLLVMAALVCMVETGQIYGWMVIIILGREFLISGFRAVAAAQGIVIAAGITGKIKTVLQMVAIPLLLLENWPFALFTTIPFDQIVLWAAVAMTIISGAEYIVKNVNVFRS